MTCSDILNLIAIVVIPIVAVWLGKYLQDRAELRKDKMNVFRSVMTFRYGWSPEGVKALNSIHIVFSDDKDVRESWRKYYMELCKPVQNNEEMKRREDAMYNLLESMAKNLGYLDEITREDIRNPYVPQAMIDTINTNTAMQAGMLNIVQQWNSSIVESEKHIETE